MRIPPGTLLSGMLVAMATWTVAQGFIPVRSLRERYTDRVRSPDEDLDELINRLRKEQQLRALEKQGHSEHHQVEDSDGRMQGRLFGPAYHRKLGHGYHRPEYPHNRPPPPTNNLNPDLSPQQHQDPSIDAVRPEPEVRENEAKQTTIVKESTKPVSGEKVINVEKVEPVEEEKMPQGEMHPTPAFRQAREDLNRLNPLQNVANMADVYFLELRRDVKELRDTVAQTPSPKPVETSTQVKPQKQVAEKRMKTSALSNMLFIAVVAGCSVAGLVGLVVAGVCWYRLQKNVKAASEAEYPAYGITGPTKERIQSPGDRKLAQSAQMYHYQHQKQQMIALEKANSEMKQDGSDEDSEEENEEGDYTVYECPGLAPTGEMEVKNPLFSEDTPVTPTMPGNK